MKSYLNRAPHSSKTSPATLFWTLLLCVLCALFINMLLRHAALRSRILLGTVLSIAFALFAYRVRAASFSGAAAGALLSLVLYVTAGLPGMGTLLCVFLLTWLATKAGARRKQQLGVAERSHGRNGAQVLANLWISAMAAGLSVVLPWSHALQVASLAALAEAASDTTSSEVGQAFGRRARLITDGSAVPIGTDGGISFIGVFAGLIAAILVACEAVLTGQAAMRAGSVIALCGFLGMIFDSFLGALLEREGFLTNNAVNLASTCSSALLAIAFSCL